MLNRAYSILDIKAIDEEERVITGIASRPEADRDGDIMESKGAQFQLPMPFLWQHNRLQPIGEVFFAKVTSAGIEIKARIPKIIEPGLLQDRVEEAWQSFKYKLVRGLSVGFRPVETARIDGSFGFRMLKWLWLETSGVTIAANAGATIQTIKSLDAPFLAATGTDGGSHRQPTPGVTGLAVVKVQKGTSPMAKTYAEQIKDFQATKAAKAASLKEIMDKSGESGETLDAQKSEEFDTLQSEIEAIDKHLARLETLEKANVETAKPIAGGSVSDASHSRQIDTVRVKENLPPGIEFARLVICKMASFMSGGSFTAMDFAKQHYPDNPRIQLTLKAAVAPGLTTDGTWAGPTVYAQNLAGEFIEFLRPMTILGKFGTTVDGVAIPSLRRVPFNVRMIGQTTGGAAYWVGQAKPKPLTKFDFAATSLAWAKVATIAVVADELARFSVPNAEDLVRQALAEAIVAKLDSDLVNPAVAAVSNVSPASLTNGLSPLSSAGPTADNIRTDIQTVVAQYIADNLSPTGLVLVMPNTLALAASVLVNSLGQPEFPGMTMTGGRILGIPVIASQYAAFTGGPGNLVVGINAPEVFLSDDGQVTVDASREASLEMSDAPTQDGSTGSGSTMVSLWQNNLLGLKAERYINWAKRRPQAVVYMDDVNWGSVGSPS